MTMQSAPLSSQKRALRALSVSRCADTRTLSSGYCFLMSRRKKRLDTVTLSTPASLTQSRSARSSRWPFVVNSTLFIDDELSR